LTSIVDVMPTLLEAARVRAHDGLQGQSQLGLWLQNGGRQPTRDAIFAEKTYHEHYDPIRCIRTERFKYIRNFAPRPMLVLPSDVYNSPSRRSLTDDEALWKHRPTEEFYDLEEDPWERNNLADSPAASDLVSQAQARLFGWMEDTGDPLLQGPIPRSETACVPAT
jgi:arylsulfatase A-like enzyme